MDHRDHVRLLREGVVGSGTIWADFGSGQGAFTLALADLLGPTGSIHTVDRNGRALQAQERALRDAFPSVRVTPLFRSGAFTLALADLLGPTGSIHTVDRNGRALQAQERALRDAFPSVRVTPLV